MSSTKQIDIHRELHKWYRKVRLKLIKTFHQQKSIYKQS